MLLKYFYDPALAHASYLVGCQRSHTAIVVDPGRDIEPYLQAARENDLKITGVAETHIHADYVSGARQLAHQVAAKLYVSDQGPAEWKYEYLEPYDHQLLVDGDHFQLGKIRFQVLHTPGHTPESISFVVTDQGGGADQPMGMFTGDFIFVGSIGRPDLLEEAAGIFGSAKVGAHELFASVEKFRQLPDFLQIWPAHGAGSACGKGLGAIPSSTVGYEKRFNPALQFHDESEFVDYILSDQPEAPKYFAVMKRVNKEGPTLLDQGDMPPRLPESAFQQRDDSAVLVDLALTSDFRDGHLPDSINLPLASLATWAGWLLDYDRAAYLVGSLSQVAEAQWLLWKIGYERVLGSFDREELQRAGRMTATYPQQEAAELREQIETGRVLLWDVRSAEECKQGRIPAAQHVYLGRLPEHLSQLDDQRPIVVQCQVGNRSAIAASLVAASGREVIDMAGGYQGWREAGLPTSGPGDRQTLSAGTN